MCALINEIFRNGEKERGSRSGINMVLESVIVNDSSSFHHRFLLLAKQRKIEREKREKRELLSFATSEKTDRQTNSGGKTDRERKRDK